MKINISYHFPSGDYILKKRQCLLVGMLLSDSSSDEDSSEEDQDSEVEHEWGELDADADTTDESTRR